MFGVLIGTAPDPGSYQGGGQAAPLTEFQAIVDEVSAVQLHEGLAPAWAKGSPQTRVALAALAERRQFEAFYAASEDIGLRAGVVLRAAGWRGRLVVVAHAIRSPKRKAAMRLVGRRVISDFICVSKDQQRILVEEVGMPSDRVHWCANWVDTAFFSPGHAPGEHIFACGLENRDYPTLLAAAGTLDLPFVVAASGFFGRDSGLSKEALGNVRVLEHRVPWMELRDLYRRARFVVLPLNPVEYAAGVTGFVEAAAMGKAVIATASPGVAEYLVDGQSGLVVPPGDPAALAEAIRTLWNDPERCEAMGRRNRIWAEREASVASYARKVAGLLRSPGMTSASRAART
jgi:glycosyltransferase involved in cell wall biosynthesis